MILQLSEALGIERVKNNQIRPSTVTNLKVAGKDDRFIATITKHRDPNTLKHYDPCPEMTTRCEAAQAIMTVKIPKVVTETVEITKKVSRTSIIEDTAIEINDKPLLECNMCLKKFGSNFG